jgi:hypothetical protein
MEALTAYATYTRGRDWRTTPAQLSVVPPEHVPAERPEEMVRLGEAEVAADAAVRDVQRELRDIDAEIKLSPRPRLGARVGRAVRRARVNR